MALVNKEIRCHEKCVNPSVPVTHSGGEGRECGTARSFAQQLPEHCATFLPVPANRCVR